MIMVINYMEETKDVSTGIKTRAHIYCNGCYAR